MTLETAYTRFLPRIRSWASFAGVPQCDVDDVAQDVFRAFRRRKRDLPDRVVPQWLRAVTKRIARRHLAKTYGRRDRSGYDAAKHAAPEPSQESALGERETEAVILELVARLRPERREVFVRHVLAEEPMERIAAEQGIPLPTAYTRLRLAREDLQEAIERTRAKERRTAKGFTSFGLLPPFLFSRRALYIAAPALGAVGALVVLALLLADDPQLAPLVMEAPARELPAPFVPVLTLAEAPLEQEAGQGGHAPPGRRRSCRSGISSRSPGAP